MFALPCRLSYLLLFGKANEPCSLCHVDYLTCYCLASEPFSLCRIGYLTCCCLASEPCSLLFYRLSYLPWVDKRITLALSYQLSYLQRLIDERRVAPLPIIQSIPTVQVQRWVSNTVPLHSIALTSPRKVLPHRWNNFDEFKVLSTMLLQAPKRKSRFTRTSPHTICADFVISFGSLSMFGPTCQRLYRGSRSCSVLVNRVQVRGFDQLVDFHVGSKLEFADLPNVREIIEKCTYVVQTIHSFGKTKHCLKNMMTLNRKCWPTFLHSNCSSSKTQFFINR